MERIGQWGCCIASAARVEAANQFICVVSVPFSDSTGREVTHACTRVCGGVGCDSLSILVIRTMSRRKRKLDELADLAAELGGEDGGDPVEFHRKPWDAPKRAGRKGRQLCGQVKDSLHVALAG